MHKDDITLKGRLDIYLNNQFVLSASNLVVTTGKEFVASRMVGNTANLMSHMAIGTGTTVPVAANTTAESEVARVALNSTSLLNTAVTYTAHYPAGTPSSDSAITEAALLDSATGGVMLCRTVFPVVNKLAADSLTIEWTVQPN
jgi:hypothetical protein